MKKILISLLFCFPLVVFASVDENTQVRNWDASLSGAESSCLSAESENDSTALNNATSGYYLYCVKVSCNNGTVNHSINNQLSKVIKCSNGNTNPLAEIVASGASGDENKTGASCTTTGTYLYATEKIQYNCGKINNQAQSNFVASSTTTTRNTNYVAPNTNNNSNGNNNIESPDTGVEDYFLVLGITVAILISSLYVVNKQNVFKRV